MYLTPRPETPPLSRTVHDCPAAFSLATPVRTRRNRRKSFLFMHLLHNLRTPRGWGRHPRAFSRVFSPAEIIPFRIRIYAKIPQGVRLIRTRPGQVGQPFPAVSFRFFGFLLTDPRPGNTGHPLSARLRALCVSALSFSVLCLSTFNLQLSTIPLPQNFYPPASDLRHNPAAQGRHPQSNLRTGRIQ